MITFYILPNVVLVCIWIQHFAYLCDMKTYYFAYNRLTNKTIVATYKSAIARHVGICRATVSRNLKNSVIYEHKHYIIGKASNLTKIKGGFALK